MLTLESPLRNSSSLDLFARRVARLLGLSADISILITGNRQIQQLNRRYTSILINMVEQAEASGEIPKKVDPRVVRDMLFGAIEHSAWRHTIGKRPIDVESMARAITDIFLTGLCPESMKP